MGKVAVLAKIKAKEGQRDDLVKAFEQALKNVESETGTLTYILHKDNGDADTLWFYEMYTDEDAFKAHGTSEGMKALGPVVAPFMGGRPELIMLEPLGGKGL